MYLWNAWQNSAATAAFAAFTIIVIVTASREQTSVYLFNYLDTAGLCKNFAFPLWNSIEHHEKRPVTKKKERYGRREGVEN